MRPAVILLILLPFVTMASEREEYLWKKRVLMIAAPSLTDPLYRTQAAELIAAWEGLAERDFAVRTRMNSSAFSVVLIGKDGGEKLRRATPLSPKELFAIVDAMPMRQAEMREGER